MPVKTVPDTEDIKTPTRIQKRAEKRKHIKSPSAITIKTVPGTKDTKAFKRLRTGVQEGKAG